MVAVVDSCARSWIALLLVAVLFVPQAHSKDKVSDTITTGVETLKGMYDVLRKIGEDPDDPETWTVPSLGLSVALGIVAFGQWKRVKPQRAELQNHINDLEERMRTRRQVFRGLFAEDLRVVLKHADNIRKLEAMTTEHMESILGFLSWLKHRKNARKWGEQERVVRKAIDNWKNNGDLSAIEQWTKTQAGQQFLKVYRERNEEGKDWLREYESMKAALGRASELFIARVETVNRNIESEIKDIARIRHQMVSSQHRELEEKMENLRDAIELAGDDKELRTKWEKELELVRTKYLELKRASEKEGPKGPLPHQQTELVKEVRTHADPMRPTRFNVVGVHLDEEGGRFRPAEGQQTHRSGTTPVPSDDVYHRTPEGARKGALAENCNLYFSAVSGELKHSLAEMRRANRWWRARTWIPTGASVSSALAFIGINVHSLSKGGQSAIEKIEKEQEEKAIEDQTKVHLATQIEAETKANKSGGAEHGNLDFFHLVISKVLLERRAELFKYLEEKRAERAFYARPGSGWGVVKNGKLVAGPSLNGKKQDGLPLIVSLSSEKAIIEHSAQALKKISTDEFANTEAIADFFSEHKVKKEGDVMLKLKEFYGEFFRMVKAELDAEGIKTEATWYDDYTLKLLRSTHRHLPNMAPYKVEKMQKQVLPETVDAAVHKLVDPTVEGKSELHREGVGLGGAQVDESRDAAIDIGSDAPAAGATKVLSSPSLLDTKKAAIPGNSVVAPIPK